jgi:hypothetical protein
MAEEDTAQEINFEGDQERFETHHQDERDHFVKAMEHHAGLGPDPGKYRGPGPKEPEEREDTSEALAAEYLREAGPARELPPPGPLPPQESVEQPTPAGGKKKPGKPPGGTTPAAIGASAVKPEEPEGGF